MTNIINVITDIYSPEEIAEMNLEDVMDIIHDIYGNYESIKKDAFIVYMKAFAESKKS